MADQGNNGHIDFDTLAEQAQAQAKETEQLADALEKRSHARRSEADALISEVSKQLATIRRASDLPDKDASQFAQAIRERQHEVT